MLDLIVLYRQPMDRALGDAALGRGVGVGMLMSAAWVQGVLEGVVRNSPQEALQDQAWIPRVGSPVQGKGSLVA